ncbi:unnamed protein product [Brassica napus]|uniref:(rape) hypothetical protein n=1 Tax=Brassica napus TaxID=3708 RepID=A0A816RXU2_BRANA|nr:unnamed protein product [Brassica napus]
MNWQQEEQLISKSTSELEHTFAAKSNPQLELNPVVFGIPDDQPLMIQPPRTDNAFAAQTKSHHRLSDLHQENRESKHHLKVIDRSNKKRRRITREQADKHRNATTWRDPETPSTKRAISPKPRTESRRGRGRRQIYFRNPDLTSDRDFHNHTQAKEPHILSSATPLRSSKRNSTRSGTVVAQTPRTSRKEERGRRERRGERGGEATTGEGRTGAEKAAGRPTKYLD